MKFCIYEIKRVVSVTSIVTKAIKGGYTGNNVPAATTSIVPQRSLYLVLSFIIHLKGDVIIIRVIFDPAFSFKHKLCLNIRGRFQGGGQANSSGESGRSVIETVVKFTGEG